MASEMLQPPLQALHPSYTPPSSPSVLASTLNPSY
jgi:hypothetical protein